VAFAATDYPFLDILWTMLIFFLWISWFWLAISVLTSILRRSDLGGGAKTLWILFVLFIPLIGVFAYLVSNAGAIEQSGAGRAQYGGNGRLMADTGGAAAEIDTAKRLLDSGAITSAEFDTLKAKALA
jgi:hypothetical protein